MMAIDIQTSDQSFSIEVISWDGEPLMRNCGRRSSNPWHVNLMVFSSNCRSEKEFKDKGSCNLKYWLKCEEDWVMNNKPFSMSDNVSSTSKWSSG